MKDALSEWMKRVHCVLADAQPKSKLSQVDFERLAVLFDLQISPRQARGVATKDTNQEKAYDVILKNIDFLRSRIYHLAEHGSPWVLCEDLGEISEFVRLLRAKEKNEIWKRIHEAIHKSGHSLLEQWRAKDPQLEASIRPYLADALNVLIDGPPLADKKVENPHPPRRGPGPQQESLRRFNREVLEAKLAGRLRTSAPSSFWTAAKTRDHEFNECVDELAKLRQELYGIPFDDGGYELKPLGYEEEDFSIYAGQWERRRISAVTMIAINHGLFRRERLRWQVKHGRKLPKNYVWPDEVPHDESKSAMKLRLNIELDGEEPWTDALRSLKIFIADAKAVEDWKEAYPSDRGFIERHEATLEFWTRYLTKLDKNQPIATNRDRKRRGGLRTSLQTLDHLAFYAHCFEYEDGGGEIHGTHLFNYLSAPKGFKSVFKVGLPAPPAYLAISEAIKRTQGQVVRS